MTYRITEKWYIDSMLDNVETTEVRTLKEVRAYIKDFIETWKENIEEAEKELRFVKTDNKTFAHIRVREKRSVLGHDFSSFDTFKVTVKKLNPKP